MTMHATCTIVCVMQPSTHNLHEGKLKIHIPYGFGEHEGNGFYGVDYSKTQRIKNNYFRFAHAKDYAVVQYSLLIIITVEFNYRFKPNRTEETLKR